jgi:hypothetical protein
VWCFHGIWSSAISRAGAALCSEPFSPVPSSFTCPNVSRGVSRASPPTSCSGVGRASPPTSCPSWMGSIQEVWSATTPVWSATLSATHTCPQGVFQDAAAATPQGQRSSCYATTGRGRWRWRKSERHRHGLITYRRSLCQYFGSDMRLMESSSYRAGS